MYVPRHNRLDDRDQLLAFIRRYSFGTLVTMLDGAPFATHLPFMVDVESGEFVLKAHLARANPQWKSFGNGDALAIFTGPHAYVSASWYESRTCRRGTTPPFTRSDARESSTISRKRSSSGAA